MRERRILKIAVIVLLCLGIILSVWAARDIAKPIVLSIAVAYILNPIVKLLSRYGLNEKLSVLVIIVMVITLFCLILLYIIPIIGRELFELMENWQVYQDKINSLWNNTSYKKMPEYIRNIGSSGLKRLQNAIVLYVNHTLDRLVAFVRDIPSYALTPVFIYYFLSDKAFFKDMLINFIPARVRDKSIELGREIDKVIGSFVKSQLILSLVISALSLVVLMVFKIKFALVIAIINGITNMIPYFGPIIGLIPAVGAAASQSLTKGIIVTAAFLVIQQIESNLISPRLVGNSIGIHPVFVVIIILLGGKYYGAIGMVISIPIAGAIKVVCKYVIKLYNDRCEILQ